MLWCIGLGIVQECLLQHSSSFVKNSNILPETTTSEVEHIVYPQRMPQGGNKKAHSLFCCKGVLLYAGSLNDFIRVFDSLSQPQSCT